MGKMAPWRLKAFPLPEFISDILFIYLLIHLLLVLISLPTCWLREVGMWLQFISPALAGFQKVSNRLQLLACGQGRNHILSYDTNDLLKVPYSLN